MLTRLNLQHGTQHAWVEVSIRVPVKYPKSRVEILKIIENEKLERRKVRQIAYIGCVLFNLSELILF